MKKPDNLIFVIFGASGDLTRRKLIPSIYDLYLQEMLPESFAVLGASRSDYTDSDFRKNMKETLAEFGDEETDGEDVNGFIQKLYYMPVDTDEKGDLKDFKERLLKLDKELKTDGNFIFYLATPPKLYDIIPQKLADYGLNKDQHTKGWKRIIIEKPFGYSYESAVELNKNLLCNYNEEQIFRIDHYLGKETVQNLLVTRFANGIFEPLWNRNYVHHVEITSIENMGVGNRGGYYDESGAMRDMVQNHLLQLVGLTAMEPPIKFDSDSIRNEIVKVFQSLHPLTKEQIKANVIRGQYVESKIKGEKVKGYRDEKGVDKDSRTETFVAMKFYIDNWRWGGVPFYIRTGKHLPTKVTEVVIHFKPTPHSFFSSKENVCESCNYLVIRIQPDEGILLKFGMKIPGSGFKIQDVNMDFHYSDLSNSNLPTAYERLLHDAMIGDSTLYARGDGVEAAWNFIDPIINEWNENDDIKLYGYPAGSWGPEEIDSLIEEIDMSWRYPCRNLDDDGKFCEL